MRKIFLFSTLAVLSVVNFYCSKTEIAPSTEGVKQPLFEQVAPVFDRDDVCSGKVKIKLLSVNPGDRCVQIVYNRHYCGQSYYTPTIVNWTPTDPSWEREMPILNDESLELFNIVYNCDRGQSSGVSATFEITMPGKTPYTITMNNQTNHLTPKFLANGLSCSAHDCIDGQE